MVRTDAATVFRALLGWFVLAPVGFTLANAFAPPGVAAQLAYGVPVAALVGVVGAFAAVRYAVETRRLAWALVTLYLASFVALVGLQTVARFTVGWIRGPWPAVAALAAGVAAAYRVAFTE